MTTSLLKRRSLGNDVVLTVYTSDTLTDPVKIIGEVSAQIWIQSSRPSADVFVRLCDVDTRDRSFNVCDGLVTVRDAQEITCATVQLWPTAYRFQRGHRIRVQVSSGAFPRYARNHGSDEPLATATALPGDSGDPPRSRPPLRGVPPGPGLRRLKGLVSDGRRLAQPIFNFRLSAIGNPANVARIA